ncbi:unnamed protein product [Pleuronectes platessa]|uniref:Growth factor receptor domain-containing protein n=1 Tax=Pleuronectes platessa TaxID=8262 RepID=A0A9N7Z0H3_PLEPL|nr:unnamed protein product [Pleuronectes platessa]
MSRIRLKPHSGLNAAEVTIVSDGANTTPTKEGGNSECHTSDASCKICFGPQAQDCSSCFKVHIFTGYILDQDRSCVAQCPSGSYANTATQLCEDCSPNCEACIDTSDNCDNCTKGSYRLFVHQGHCWSNCPE